MTEKTGKLVRPLNLSSLKLPEIVMIAAAVISLPAIYYLIPDYYQVLHAGTELTFVIICFGIFIIAWNVRHSLDTSYIFFLGNAFLVTGVFSFMHALTYEGMYLFQELDTYVVSYHFESISIIIKSFSLLVAPYFLTRKWPSSNIFFIFTLTGVLFLYLAVSPGKMPLCDIEGGGASLFRSTLEGVCSLFLVGAVWFHYKNRACLDAKIYKMMITGIAFIIPTGFVVIFQLGPEYFQHFVWYVLSLVSYFFIYSALIQAGLLNPQAALFKDLQESQKLIEAAKNDWEKTFDAVPDLIAIIDKNHRIKRVNATMAQKMGMTPQEAVGTKCFDFFHSSAGPIDACPHCKTLSEGETFNLDLYEKKHNSHFWVTTTPVKDSSGAVVASIHVAHDVTQLKKTEEELRLIHRNLEILVEKRTEALSSSNEELLKEINERKLAEESLRKSEKQFRQLSQEFNALLDGIPDILLLVSDDSKVVWANVGASKAFGKPVSKIVGSRCYEFLNCTPHNFPNNVVCQKCPIQQSLNTKNSFETKLVLQNKRTIHVRTYPIRDESGNPLSNVILIGSDITDKLSLESENLRNRNLSSLGELAAGVAHEINNPINGIINYAQLLLNSLVESSEGKEVAARIIKEGDRVANIVSSLLSFARGSQDTTKSYVTIDDILDDSLSLVGVQLTKDQITLLRGEGSYSAKVFANSHQIEQILLNVLSNSRFALNEKYPNSDPNKKIEIDVSSIEIASREMVRLSIKDYGVGIKSEILDNIWDPFYTTKSVGKGTGLGLSISHGIINEHNGHITIESEEGEFTIVNIDLPTKDS